MSEKRKRKVCVVLVDRANYGRLKPVMHAIAERPGLTLQVLATGTMVLERFDQPVNVVRQDGFQIDGEIYIELEGSTPTTMAKSVGFGLVEFASEFHRLKPDVVLLIGDRYEALAGAIAAAYMNIPIVHIQGGEVSGSIDESARHAISKFSHFHFPSTKRSAEYLVRMGERPDTILGIGCPSSDIARMLDRRLDAEVVNSRGHGAEIDISRPYLLVVFHPTTTEFGGERGQMDALLAAIGQIAQPTLLLWPNIDAGSDHISKSIREFRTLQEVDFLRTITNLSPENYLRVLGNAACAIGNSSSFVRDAGYFGTPVVLVGNRQKCRECDAHVRRVPVDVDAIASAIRHQLQHGAYAPSKLYGDGHVAERIAEQLERLVPYVQKQLAFAEEFLQSHVPPERLKILVAEPLDFSPQATDILRPLGNVELRRVDRDELRQAFERYDIVWFRLAHRIDAAVLGEQPRCRILATPVTGLDHIDLEACSARGIQVVSLRGEMEFLRGVRATAELTLAITLALLRRIPEAVASVKTGAWNRDMVRGHELFGKTAGIVGVGRLGTIVAEYFHALGMRVLGYDPRSDISPVVERVSTLDELLRQSDVVSLHVNYGLETHHLIGTAELAHMRPTAVLVNTARGGVVDDAALRDALAAGRIAGAAIDVVDGEPDVAADHPLIEYARSHDNLLLVPHIGGNTHESFEKTELFLAGRVTSAARDIWKPACAS